MPNCRSTSSRLYIRMQRAACWSRPARACLLDVVFQGAGNVGVNDQPHVRLVDAHAEGVGGGDGAQVAGDEAVLDVFLGFRRHGAVEESGLKALLLEELGDFLGLAAGGAVDDGPARLVPGEVGGDYAVNVRQFVGRVGLDDDKLQVGASGAAVQVFQVDLQFLVEVLDYFRLDVGLGGGGEAEDWWYWPVSGGLLDESAPRSDSRS